MIAASAIAQNTNTLPADSRAGHFACGGGRGCACSSRTSAARAEPVKHKKRAVAPKKHR